MLLGLRCTATLVLLAWLCTASAAGVHKCQDAQGRTVYSSSPCAAGQKSKPTSSTSRLSLPSDDALAEHVYSLKQLLDTFQCDSPQQGFSTLPSKTSLDFLMRDLATIPRDELEQFGRLRSQKKYKIVQVPDVTVYNRKPCQVGMSISHRNTRTRLEIDLAVKRRNTTEDERDMARWVQLLKANGYAIQRVSPNSEFYRLEWKKTPVKCSVRLSGDMEKIRFALVCYGRRS